MTLRFGGKDKEALPAYSIFIAELRKALGLSQAEMAERVGIAQPTWCQYERGQRKPGRKNLLAIKGAAKLSDKRFAELRGHIDAAIVSDAVGINDEVL